MSHLAQSFDVDGPPTGEHRLVSGVRQALDSATAVFVEDVGATDVTGLRLARAVGFSQALPSGVALSARYERGVRALVDASPVRDRDAGGVSLSWEVGRARLFARGEARRDTAASAPTVMQWFASAGGEADFSSTVTASTRGQFIHSMRGSVLEQRLFEVIAAIAWRPAWGGVIARYSFVRELRPGLSSERLVHLVSLLPTVHVGDRLRVAAGAHLGVSAFGVVGSVSLRPALRVYEGAELGLEVARRTSAPDGGELMAVRAEAGYRFNDHLFIGLGWSLFGYSGTGLDDGAPVSRQRLYARAEVGY